jgi:hypothetical protein
MLPKTPVAKAPPGLRRVFGRIFVASGIRKFYYVYYIIGRTFLTAGIDPFHAWHFLDCGDESADEKTSEKPTETQV